MASTEIIISEHEWNNLQLVKDLSRYFFDVGFRRKDEIYEDYDYDNDGISLKDSKDNTKKWKGCESSFLRIISMQNEDSFSDSVLRPPPVIVCVETNGPSGNLKKFKRFAIACQPTHPDYKIIQLHLGNETCLEMVKASCSEIQQSTLALISLGPGQFVVSIQGHRVCVDTAKQEVERMILHNSQNQCNEKNEYNLNLDNCIIPNSMGTTDKATEKIIYQNTVLTTEEHNQMLSTVLQDNNLDEEVKKNQIDNLLKYKDIYDFPNETDVENKVNKTALSTSDFSQKPFQQYRNIPSEETLSSSDEDKIFADKRFQKRIDQATKCGFSDDQVIKVLKSLGVESSMDDMMRELVKDSQETTNEESAELSVGNFQLGCEGPSWRGEESESDEDFDPNDSSNLRHIVVDGSNVAMSHGQKIFSCMGIKIVVDWFRKRGHKNITVFVPQWRKEASRPDAPISDQHILTELEMEKIVVFTPSRRVGGTRIVCYDDRFMLKLAVEIDGIVVSNDVYRDLVREKDDFRQVVEKRLLMYSFVQDIFMPPEDPLGRQGPSLDNFLRIKPAEPKNKPPNCTYGKKCTYGLKCKFYHPERRYAPPDKMVAEKLKENAELKQKARKNADEKRRTKLKLSRTTSMLPQNFDENSLSAEEESGKNMKPALQHSISVGNSDSYLTELRLKMEKAELSDLFQQNPVPQLKGSSAKTEPQSAERKLAENSLHVSGDYDHSPQITPTVNMIESDLNQHSSFSPPPNSFPAASLSTSTISLNIPNPEQHERYLSGHVLVAKRLSNEGNSIGNFFSHHTSRTSGCTQLPANIPPDDHLLSSESNTDLGDQVHIPQQIQSNEYQLNSKEIFFPPDNQTQTSRSQLVSRGPLTVSQTSSFKPSEESSLSYGSVTGPPKSKNYNSCPTFSQPDYQSHHQSLQRSMSSSNASNAIPGNLNGRKFSLNVLNNSRPTEKANIKLQCSLPPNPQSFNSGQPYPIPSLASQYPYNQHSHRSRKSIDSGLGSSYVFDQSSGAMFSPGASPRSPFTSAPQNPYMVPCSPTPNTAHSMMFPHGMSSQYSHPQSQANRFDYPAPPLSYSSNNNLAQNSSSQNPNYSYQMPLNIPFQDNGPIELQSNPATPSSFSNPHHLYASMNPHFQPMHSMNFVEPESQYYSMQASGLYGPNTPSSPFMQVPPPFMSPPIHKATNEDAPISVDDPRYSIYYNLSNIHGEKIVRNFMNRNPDVKNLKDLHTLISSFKADNGL